MDLIQERILPTRSALSEHLLAKAHGDLELPPLSELTTALIRLAQGKRTKCLLPVGIAPLEYALVRRGRRVFVSVYETSSAPEVHQLERPVDLSRLIRVCADEARAQAQNEPDKAARQIALHFADRVLRTDICADVAPRRARLVKGGAKEPGKGVLSFGYEVELEERDGPTSRAQRADVHALLVTGTLWAHLHGRRCAIAKGPILLAVQRMVVAVRALFDAWESGRPTNVRLRAGEFGVGVRLTKHDVASLTLRTTAGELKLSDVRPDEVALPILALAADLIRSLVRADRSQTRNLRVVALRDEVRALRKAVRQQGRPDGFINEDAERMREASPLSEVPPMAETPRATPRAANAPSGSMRFESRWRLDLDGLFAAGTYFCGDRLVLSGPQHTLAVERGTGDVLWAREGAEATIMAGPALLRMGREGEVELCSVKDGEAYASTRIAPRSGPQQGFYMSAPGIAPVAVVAEGTSGLVALDLHTGQPRWRFQSRRAGAFHARRAGRILLVADEGAIHAIDAGTGEDLWRFAIRGRFSHAPVVTGDRVIAVAEGRKGQVFGIDLYSGQEAFRLSLGEAPAAAPIGAPGLALLTLGDERLVAIDTKSGHVRWDVSDPGISIGASALVVDELLVTNAPGGGLAATELSNGSPRWTELLGDPIGDEVPRRLEPVLRGGALFVPAGDVHIVRPSDGEVLGSIDGDIVPDRLRVDERGWVYIAEESGHVAAFAPVTALRLIRGGA